MSARAARLVMSVVLATAWSCSNVTTNFSDLKTRDGASAPLDAGRDAGSHDAGYMLDAATMNAPTQCGGHSCACDDGVDNDGDARFDGLDPECTGRFDDDEASFATGAPAGKSGCQDCFWDHNAGSGDDDCRYPSACLENPNAATGKGSCSSCEVSQRCIDTCVTRTPNGCDCFGCCEVTRSDGSQVAIVLGDGCALDKLDDVSACPGCTLHPSCQNPCGRCELCPGRTVDQLPADCGAGKPTSMPRYVCDEGQQVCSANTPCGTELYCQLGCCLWAVE